MDKESHFQFKLRDVMLLFLLLGAVLALATQLRHIGIAAGVFLVGIAIGAFFRNWPLMTGGLTALLVFVVTYLACWVRLGTVEHMDVWTGRYTRTYLEQIAEALHTYNDLPEGLPADLSSLAIVEQSGQAADHWQNPLVYERTANGFRLGSLGRDGAPGGAGLDADIFYGESLHAQNARLPWRQFLFETQGSGGVFLAAVVASFMAGSFWFGMHRDLKVASTRAHVVGISVTMIAAVIVAGFLAAFHVAASQSGH